MKNLKLSLLQSCTSHVYSLHAVCFKVGCDIILTFTSELKGKGTRFFHQSNVGCDIFWKFPRAQKENYVILY